MFMLCDSKGRCYTEDQIADMQTILDELAQTKEYIVVLEGIIETNERAYVQVLRDCAKLTKENVNLRLGMDFVNEECKL